MLSVVDGVGNIFGKKGAGTTAGIWCGFEHQRLPTVFDGVNGCGNSGNAAADDHNLAIVHFSRTFLLLKPCGQLPRFLRAC